MSTDPGGPAWKERRQIPDGQVRDAADQYDDARRLIASQPPDQIPLLALLNAAAVAVELYLKALNSRLLFTPDGDVPGVSVVTVEVKEKHHRLVDQLRGIRNDVRGHLEREYASSHGGVPLATTLARFEGLFDTSRYPFEHGKAVGDYPVPMLMDLCDFLRAFVGMSPSRCRG